MAMIQQHDSITVGHRFMLPSLSEDFPAHETLTPNYKTLQTMDELLFVGQTDKKDTAPEHYAPAVIEHELLTDMETLHKTIELESRSIDLSEPMQREKEDPNTTNMYLTRLQMLLEQYGISTIFHTDGSKQTGFVDGEKEVHIGSAVYHTSTSRKNSATYIHEPEWTSYAAELMALYIAFKKAVPTETTLICSDCLSAILAIKYYPTKNTTRRLKKCFSWLLAQIMEKLQIVQKKGGKILLYKVPAHIGIFPNMQADALADIACDQATAAHMHPTTDIPLTAVAATIQHHNKRLHRPAYKYIRQVVTGEVKKKLTSDAHTKGWIPMDYEDGYPAGRVHTPLSYKMFNRKLTPHCLSKFLEELSTERQKLPITAKTQTPEIHRCPLCGRDSRCDTVHYVFLCNKTRDARMSAAANIKASRDPNIRSLHARSLHALEDRQYASQYADMHSVNYLFLGPDDHHDIFKDAGNKKRCPTELFELHRNITRAYQLAWRKHAPILNRTYNKIRIRKAALQQQTANSSSEEDEQ